MDWKCSFEKYLSHSKVDSKPRTKHSIRFFKISQCTASRPLLFRHSPHLSNCQSIQWPNPTLCTPLGPIQTEYWPEKLWLQRKSGKSYDASKIAIGDLNRKKLEFKMLNQFLFFKVKILDGCNTLYPPCILLKKVPKPLEPRNQD